jgi:hypothetical protein
MTENLLIAILGGGNLLLFVKFLIERHDAKKDKDIGSTLIKLEKDGLRTQLLLMILLKPKEETEILTIAEHYFKKPPEGLGGNWYMTSMFKSWLKEYTVGQPEWFETE